MDQCNINLGPYRATKLWNEVVRSFRDGIPLKRHRRHVRVYENCFTGSEAVDWLHLHMKNNPNFGPNITTRNQSLQLLRKFVKNGLFEDTRGCKCVNADEFKDNGELYRFNKKSPMKLNQTPKAFHRRDNNFLNDDSNQIKLATKDEENTKNIQLKSIRKLSVQEIEDIWKNVVLKKLQDKLALPDLEVILDTQNMNSKNLIHNSTRIDKNGFVSVIDKNEDLPHWILSAMKCLLNWPNGRGSGSCLPNYPGFELDVFGVVRDYFTNLSTPLIPDYLYHVFIKVFLRAEYLDIDLKTSSPTPIDNDFDNFSPAKLSSFPTVDNLLQEASLEDPNLIQIPSDQISNITLPSHLYFETAFTSIEPVTRIIRHQPPFYLHPPKLTPPEPETNLNLRRLHSLRGGYDNLGFLEHNYKEIQRRIVPESLSSYHTAPSRVRGSSATCSSYHTASNGFKRCEEEENEQESGKWMNKRRAVQEWVQKSCWPDLFSQSGRKNAVDTFKLLGLFLQPSDRRKLHYLLVFMNSICKNAELRMINKKLVSITFHRSILTSSDPIDQDDTVVLRLVNFLVDSCDEIFKVPQDLILDVNEKIKYHMENIAQLKEDKTLFTYCEQVSLAEYEKQRENHSRKALFDLFDNIIESKKLSEKEKKRKLRKFKESYPDIYSEKTNGEVDKNKRKLNFLDRVKNLRI